MSLEFAARLDARGFDVGLDVPTGQTVAVLGPNGAGKSTLVGLIAGLLRPHSGRAVLGDRTLFDIPPRPSASRSGAPRSRAPWSRASQGGRPGTDRRSEQWLPPHRRGTALLAQDALLLPHLSILDNVAFGVRSAGASRRDAAQRATTWLDAVGAPDLAHRRPAELSGGQAQRIAVARALASDPHLLLLDEPLASLDAAVAPHLRRLLRTVLADRTTVIVTHDVLDAHALADRVVVLAHGRVVEDGPTGDVLERPQHEFTARLAGLNLVSGVRTERGLRTDAGVEIVLGPGAAADGTTPACSTERGTPAGTPVVCAFPPGRVLVRPAGHGEGAVLRAVVTHLEPRGDVVRVGAATLPATAHASASATVHADLPVTEAARLGLVPGDVVDLVLPPDVRPYAARSGPAPVPPGPVSS